MQSIPRMISRESRPKLWLVGAIVLAAAAIFVGDLLLPLNAWPAVIYLLVVVPALRARQPSFVMVVAGVCTCLVIAGLVVPSARGLCRGPFLPKRSSIGCLFWRQSGPWRWSTDRRRGTRRREFLAAVVESSDDSIVSLDLQGNVSNWNRGAAAMYGYSEAEMIGTSILRIVLPQSRRGDRAHAGTGAAASGCATTRSSGRQRTEGRSTSR